METIIEKAQDLVDKVNAQTYRPEMQEAIAGSIQIMLQVFPSLQAPVLG